MEEMLTPHASNTASSAKTRQAKITDPFDCTGSPRIVLEYISGTNKLKKKRVRWAKQELDFLRRESKKLEDELAQQLRMQSQLHVNPISFRSAGLQSKKVTELHGATRGYRLIAPHRQLKPTMWRALAERQSKERRRAQARNMELRAQLEAERNLEGS